MRYSKLPGKPVNGELSVMCDGNGGKVAPHQWSRPQNNYLNISASTNNQKILKSTIQYYSKNIIIIKRQIELIFIKKFLNIM